jgi:hypothetical protein
MIENSTFNIQCQGCHRNTSLKDIRKIGSKRLCPICYNYIVSSLKGDKISESAEILENEDNIPKKSDDEGSKRLKRIVKKIKLSV